MAPNENPLTLSLVDSVLAPFEPNLNPAPPEETPEVSLVVEPNLKPDEAAAGLADTSESATDGPLDPNLNPPEEVEEGVVEAPPPNLNPPPGAMEIAEAPKTEDEEATLGLGVAPGLGVEQQTHASSSALLGTMQALETSYRVIIDKIRWKISMNDQYCQEVQYIFYTLLGGKSYLMSFQSHTNFHLVTFEFFFKNLKILVEKF